MKTLRIDVKCEIQQGSDVVVAYRMAEWSLDVTDLEFAMNVTLLALAALREARERGK